MLEHPILFYWVLYSPVVNFKTKHQVVSKQNQKNFNLELDLSFSDFEFYQICFKRFLGTWTLFLFIFLFLILEHPILFYGVLYSPVVNFKTKHQVVSKQNQKNFNLEVDLSFSDFEFYQIWFKRFLGTWTLFLFIF